MKQMAKHTIPFLSLLLLVLFSCNSSENSRESVKEEKVYEAFTLQESDLQGSISLPGELKAFESVDIFPKITGYVQSIKVDRGSKVKKGEVIVQIEAPEIMAELSAAKAKVLQAEGFAQSAESKLSTMKDQYNRIQKTSQTPGTVSASDLLRMENQLKEEESNAASAKSALEAARYQLQAAQQMANYLTIRAPFDGVVTERNVHTGTLVSAQTGDKPMFRLEMNDVLRLEIPVPESYSGLDFGSDSLSFTLNSQSGKNYKAMVSRQSGSLQNASRTEIMEADVPNKDGNLKAGSFAQAKVGYKKEGSLMIPNTALVTSMEDRFVVKVVNEEAHRVSVRKGISQNGQTEIFGDLQPGDIILKNPSETIQSGDRVKVDL
ncbi:RND family efflux transporter MFP subunit [Mongoliibacter ruber]|uniref:RND family efflux transporter MFP subunit n=2 Tax=Mongoliibacter ruber TaxID=1750599 RepID=A0A2T0WHG1_9BACT|nr:RND family efflux transporter MFP subunit [Mongoliibacter ruber]